MAELRQQLIRRVRLRRHEIDAHRVLLQYLDRLGAAGHDPAPLEASQRGWQLAAVIGGFEQGAAADAGKKQHDIEPTIGQRAEPAAHLGIVFDRHFAQGRRDVGRAALVLDQPLQLVRAPRFEEGDRSAGQGRADRTRGFRHER